MKSGQHRGQTRRSLLTTQTAGIISAFAMTGIDLATPSRIHAQIEMTPDAALQELMEGNKRFREGRLRGHLEDLEILKQKTAEKQEPFAAVLSCADSRVPIEIIFDQSIGHVFVTRVAGNLVTPEIIGSLEYGAIVLGTKAILVLGHANCGAVKAAMEGKPVPGQISTLYRHLQPALEKAKSNPAAAIRENARIQRDLLRKSSPVIADLLKTNRIKVVAGFYDLATGSVTLLES
jgi:carbonic anhydrase